MKAGSIKLPIPDDSVHFFKTVKRLSEKYWTTIKIDKSIYGFQIQKNSKWRMGLTDRQIVEFEKKLKLKFPAPLKNFYQTMNGLDKPGINVYGNDGTAHTFFPPYYSFPDDLAVIRERIEWILESNHLTARRLESTGIAKIFPVTGHRFLILDPNSQILSMYGDDVVFWADSLSKLIANSIFDHIDNAADFKSNPAQAKTVKFWWVKRPASNGDVAK